MDDRVRAAQKHLLDMVGLYLGGRPAEARVAEAFRAAPRHLFVERYCTFLDRGWRIVTDDNLPDHLPALYANDALGIFVAEGDPRVATISSPEIVLYMLELLALAPGYRVYEVGAGSGWNAALMGRLVAPGGTVETVEIIPELVESARRSLARAGIDNVRVIEGDASLGPGSSGPPGEEAAFDRIVFTAGASDLPAAFFARVRPGGLLLFTLAIPGGGNVLILFERTDQGFESRATRRCSFVPVTGAGHAAGGALPAVESLPGWRELSATVVETRPFSLSISGPFPQYDRSADLRSYLWLVEPGFRCFVDDGRPSFGIVDEAHGSLALVHGGAVTVYGSAAAGDRLRHHLRTWADLGLPGLPDFAVTACPAEDSPEASDNAYVLRCTETCFVFRLP